MGLPCLPGDRSHSAEGSAGDRPEAGSCTGEEREGEPLPQRGDCLWPLLRGPPRVWPTALGLWNEASFCHSKKCLVNLLLVLPDTRDPGGFPSTIQCPLPSPTSRL